MRKILGFFAALVLGVLTIYLTAYGLSPAGVCDYGFGREHAAKEENFLRRMFREPLPARLDLDEFKCSGFQDLQIDVTFRTNASEGQALLEALKHTFQPPQNNRDLPDNQKSMQAVTYPNFKRIKFQLPTERPMHGREIAITIPNDGSKETLVEVLLYQR